MTLIPAPQAKSETVASPTSLDHREANVENQPGDVHSRQFRFAHFREYVDLLNRFLPTSNVSEERQQRWRECGSDAWIQKSQSTGKVRCVAKCCKLRWCPACRRSLNRHVQTWIEQLVNDNPADQWRFITLTLKSSNAPLATQLANLRKSFRKLRQRTFWKKSVNGGVAILELTCNESTGQWHPHYHVLCRGRWMDQRQLSMQWLSITKTSKIVDIRFVKQRTKAAAYVAKYLAKLPPVAMLNCQKRFNEWTEALDGFRTITKFGNARGYQAPERQSDYPTDWIPIAKLETILEHARNGQAWARAIIHQLKGGPIDETHPDLLEQTPATVPRLLADVDSQIHSLLE